MQTVKTSNTPRASKRSFHSIIRNYYSCLSKNLFKQIYAATNYEKFMTRLRGSQLWNKYNSKGFLN